MTASDAPASSAPASARADGHAPVSIHAAAVALGGHAVLLAGPSGAGKSSVAAGCLALGAGLVADDLCLLRPDEGGLVVSAPPTAPAAIEARGLGLLPVPLAGPARAVAILRLGPAEARLPPPRTERLAGHPLPLLRHPATPDLPAKVILLLRAAPFRDPGDPLAAVP